MKTPDRIAIVEDDTLLREELTCFFKNAGLVTHEANSYQTLLDVLQNHTVDVVLLDLNLPGMNGYEIAKNLKRLSPSTGIVMLTARAAKHDKLRGYEVGADIYFAKPVDPDELLAAVRSLAARVRGQTESQETFKLHMQQLSLALADTSCSSLSAVEVMILKALAFSPEQTLDISGLQNVLEERFPDRPFTKRALENLLSRLRKKLMQVFGDELDPIRAIRGVGYQLTWPVEVVEG